MGGLITYDPKTIKEVPHSELKIVLMYEQDGKPLSQDDGKPLRLAIIGTDGLLEEGNMWTKWITKIEVVKVNQ
jgi:DMSO/TMAO reductase YedYZ molybdopterin-dependent catalytic subunit